MVPYEQSIIQDDNMLKLPKISSTGLRSVTGQFWVFPIIFNMVHTLSAIQFLLGAWGTGC